MSQVGGSAEGIPSTEAVAGDVCMYGINEGKLIIVNDWGALKYPIDKYPPIGVVVVPGSHGHYANGKCAIMSLNHMNFDKPQTGDNSQQSMVWGLDTNIASLHDLNQVPYVGSNGNVGANVIGQTSEAYLPSDNESFTAAANPYDNKTKYIFNYNDYKYIPSPYNNDGTFNTEYSRIVSPSSTANCLADFDGYNNTKKILEIRGYKDYSSWKPSSNSEDYPAASCCDMYFTPGTKQGDWYLPSAGELGYICVRQKTINNIINKLISAGVTNASVIKYNYWSSSEYDTHKSWTLTLIDGSVNSNGGVKNTSGFTRSFCIV